LSNERVQSSTTWTVVLKLRLKIKTARRDATTEVVISPLQFMQQLQQRMTASRLRVPEIR